MHFMGSAMSMPHEQGGFREWLVTESVRCAAMGALVSPGEAACAEPLSVCLHALNQAPSLAGRRVLVSGAGPIGSLMVAVAALAGAREVIATDIADAALASAAKMGATRTVNVAADRDALAPEMHERGQLDVVFECSGSPAAIATDIAVLRPRGTLVQVGITSEATLPLSQVVGKELVLRGSQRFHPEFAWAAELIRTRRLDVRPIITATFPLSEALAAFTLASDKSRACKVQLTLS
jgi:L-idonate 5-dehydrogenase